MPHKTFNNLSPERQADIINISLNEFSRNDYASASLTNIITRLGVAKGSFYRYFESKEALYAYLLSFCRELFTGITAQRLDSAKELSALCQGLLLDFKAKEEKHPMIIRFWLKAANDRAFSTGDKNLALRQKLDMMNSGLFGCRELDLQIDSPCLDYISMVVLYHLMALIDYICLKYNVPPDGPIFSLSEEQLKLEVCRFTGILINGIKSQREMPGGVAGSMN